MHRELCAYLSRSQSAGSLEVGAMSGAILETYVFWEILKSHWHHGKQAYFNFYRDKDNKEIDLLIQENNIIYPIEIKKTANPENNAPTNFNFLQVGSQQLGHGMVICLLQKDLPLSRTVDAVPVSYL